MYKREKYSPFGDLIPLFVQLALLMGVVEAVKKGTPLTVIPIETLGVTLLVPAVAAASAFIMCFVQNKINVLQSEQGRINQYGTMIFSVGLSLYLGFFVSVGVGFYWTCSNLLSTLQLALLNMWINPKDYIDYEALEKSKEELKDARAFMTDKKKAGRSNPYRKKEKADYKRFFPGSARNWYSIRKRTAFINTIRTLLRRSFGEPISWCIISQAILRMRCSLWRANSSVPII